MKKKIYLSTVVLLAISLNVMAAQSPAKAGPTSLSILLDTAWSNDYEMSDYKSLSRQVIASRKPGDYLEIITGHPGKARLRVAQFIKTGDSQELKNITALLSGVNCPFLSDVNISKAVDMAFKRLVKSSEENDFAHTAVIVFTDGRLNDSDVNRLEQLATEFKKRNWSLWITGTYAANKKLLVAANQGKFEFSLISESNPVLWIQSKKNVRISKSAPSEGAIVEDLDSDNSGKSGYNVTIDSSVSISENVEKTGDMPSVELPADSDQRPQRSQELVIVIPEVDTYESDADNIEPNLPAEELQEEVVEESAENIKAPGFNKKLLWLLPAIGLPAVLILLFWSSISKARKLKTSLTSRLKTTEPKDPGTLLAKINGQTHNLGRSDRIKEINIGSDSRNTIKTPGESISPRHVTIYHKGTDLMLKNVGASPIAVNGLQLKPRAKQRLVIPSVVKLNDKTKVNLTMLKPKPIRSEDRSDGNGNR